MISTERAKEILNDPALSDSEIERVRDEFRALAEVVFDAWYAEREKKKTGTVQV